MGRRERNAGFTLIELLIVLAVLVGLAALAAPAVRIALAKRELQSAGKELRNAMARARLAAVETGQCQRFRYRRGTGAYEIAPLRSERGASSRSTGRSLGESLTPSSAGSDEDTQAGDSGLGDSAQAGSSATSGMLDGSRSAGGSGGATTPNLRPGRPSAETAAARRLPAEVWFADPDQPDAPPPAGSERRAETPSSDSTAADARDWSEPVLFFPNGRSTPAVLYLRGQNDLVLRIELRALTGSIKLGELTTVDAAAAKPGVPRPSTAAERPTRPTTRPPRDTTAPPPATSPTTSPASRVEPKLPLGPNSNPPAQPNVAPPRTRKTQPPVASPPTAEFPPPADPIPTEGPP